MSDEDEVVRCYQCDWPILRGQGLTVVIGVCPDCGAIHPVGYVHTEVCTLAFAVQEDRPTTQKRRAGAGGMN